jgi:hypothetical protein
MSSAGRLAIIVAAFAMGLPPVSAAAPKQPWRLAQTQTGTDDKGALPTVNVGPPPAATAPAVKESDAGDKPAAPVTPPRTFQLRVNPKTGKPLSAEDIESRSRRQVQPPRALRPSPPATAPVKAKAKAKAKQEVQSRPASQPEKGADDQGIQVKPLGRAGFSSVGLLSEAEGGFGGDTWSGTEIGLVARLLPMLPMVVDSPAMRSLTLRLLLSTAKTPAGEATDGDFIAMRIERLAAIGHLAEAEKLLAFVPANFSNPVFARVRADAALLAGNVRQACRLVRNMVGVDEAADWQMAMAFCLAVEGKSSQVELYEQLLYDSGIEDPAFFTLLGNLIRDDKAPLDSIDRPRPLHLAMLRTARQAIPADATQSAGPSTLRAIATSPNAALETRLDAAERAEALGTFGAEALRRIYASVPFSPEQRAGALDLAKRQPGPSASAILYQVTQIDAQTENRAKALRAAWRNGQRTGRYLTAVRVNLEVTRAIEADPDLAWFAGDAGRALLAAGDVAMARKWFFAVLHRARMQQPEAVAAVLALTPLLYVGDAGHGVPVLPAAMLGWWQAEVAMKAEGRYERALRLVALLTALGEDVPAALWQPVFGAPTYPVSSVSPLLLLALDDAVGGGRKGEVVLLALVALGRGGPSVADTLTLRRVVAALRAVGLEADARALAVEGLLGYGF